MYGTIGLAACAGVVFAIVTTCIGLRRNIQLAKQSGLPYIVAPWTPIGTFWNLLSELLGPLMKKVPAFSDSIWLNIIDRQGAYAKPRFVENHLGDSYLVVCPWMIYLKTTNAELASQITTRKVDFLKPVANYKIVDLFGRSILTQEGSEWKRHKKIVGPSFSERSNRLVFEESLRQAEGMMNLWAEAQEPGIKGELRVSNTAHDAATLSLHVICAAGFGVPQLWPNEKEEKLQGKGIPSFSDLKLTGSHEMLFKEALTTLMAQLVWFVLFPRWLLNNSPFQIHHTATKSFRECLDYFSELIEVKKKQVYLGDDDAKGTMDLLGPMIKASYEIDTSDSKQKSLPASQRLSKEEILGNSFIFLFAGHETTANNIHFSILELAIAPTSQRRMQADIDSTVGNKSTEEWDYHTDMPRLYNSMVGAVLAEELRVIPAIINIPKTTNGNQNVTIDGRAHVIPNKTFIHLNVVGANRNPRYWPEKPDTFMPERWLSSDVSGISTPKNGEVSEKQVVDGLEVASFETSKSSSLFKPVKGAYIPFSEGQRACPGRRFAQVEGTAVMAALFQKYSAELDVSEWASDEEVARMGRDERIAVYEKARKRARMIIGRAEQIITVQMLKGDQVPIRFVQRGNERFAGLF